LLKIAKKCNKLRDYLKGKHFVSEIAGKCKKWALRRKRNKKSQEASTKLQKNTRLVFSSGQNSSKTSYSSLLLP